METIEENHEKLLKKEGHTERIMLETFTNLF